MRCKPWARGLLAGWTLLLAGAACADEALWKLLQGGGQVVMVRHALTDPGVGDPDGMKLEDCGPAGAQCAAGGAMEAAGAAPARGQPLPVFTHGSTTLALTGISPGTSEMVILTPQQGGFRVAGRLGVR